MTSCPTLTTERLVLRPFRESDLDGYTSMITSVPVRTSLHLPETVGRYDAWSQMAMWLGQWELRGTGQWALEARDTKAFVGRAGLHNPARH
ncbi:MAG TPA: GNAT family N-acetyltransferase, partial [Acidimicrobiales bacterium]|nr:GNAT family N-acetyltransferase [Acidimicrobiales bacterium]